MPDDLDITIDGGTTASRPSLVRAHLMPQPLEHSCTPACTCVSRWSGRTRMQLTPANADVRASQAGPAIWELASIGEFEALPRRTGAELTRARKVSGLGPSRPLRLRACRASPPSLHSHASCPLNPWSLCPITSLKLHRVRLPRTGPGPCSHWESGAPHCGMVRSREGAPHLCPCQSTPAPPRTPLAPARRPRARSRSPPASPPGSLGARWAAQRSTTLSPRPPRP